MAENWSGTILVRSRLDGRVVNAGVKRYRGLNGRHLAVRHASEADAETIELQVETNQSHVRVALAARTRLLRDGQAARVPCRPVIERGFIAHELTFELEEGHPGDRREDRRAVHLRDRAISEYRLDARQAAQAATGFAELLARHAATWGHPVETVRRPADSTNEWAETILHLHLHPAANGVAPHRAPGCGRAGTRARWHGGTTGATSSGTSCSSSRLRNLQQPRVAAALLDYRHARLGAAQAAAQAAGYEGAMFPWQSGSNGRGETQQLHLNPESGRWLPDHSRPAAPRQHRHCLQRLAGTT